MKQAHSEPVQPAGRLLPESLFDALFPESVRVDIHGFNFLSLEEGEEITRRLATSGTMLQFSAT